VRKGTLIGRARYVLEHGQAKLNVRVDLTDAAFKAFRAHKRLRVVATTTERGAPVRSNVVIQRLA
jgi:hypothetical protein